MPEKSCLMQEAKEGDVGIIESLRNYRLVDKAVADAGAQGTMTSTEFARVLRVSVRTLYRWHEDGRLVPAFVLPNGDRRYTSGQLDQFRGDRVAP